MRYTPDYQLAFEGGSIEFLFNTWTFRTYSEKVGVEIDQLLPHLFSHREKLPDLLYVAADSFLKYNNKDNGYTELDAYLWMDSLGGFHSEKVIEVWKVVIRKLYNTTAEKVEEMFNGLVTTEDKKKVSGHGKSSTKKPTKQD